MTTALIAVFLSAQVQASGSSENPLRDFYSPTLTENFRDSYSTNGTVNVDVPYGLDDRQRYDVYLPHDASGAPIIVMVHGGGWTGGDKLDDGVASAKAAYWVDRGFIFVSVNYRLAPYVSVMDQASDIAAAIVNVQNNAVNWHGNPDKVILMGHGAGGHLAALVAANPGYITDQITRPLAGAVILDSVALNVPALMNSNLESDFVDTFGQEQSFWQDVSPQQNLSPAGLPFLVVCSEQNPADSCARAQAFRAAALNTGVRATVLPINLSTESVSSALGASNYFTSEVNDFINSVL